MLAESEDGSKTKVVPNFGTYNFHVELSFKFSLEFTLLQKIVAMFSLNLYLALFDHWEAVVSRQNLAKTQK